MLVVKRFRCHQFPFIGVPGKFSRDGCNSNYIEEGTFSCPWSRVRVGLGHPLGRELKVCRATSKVISHESPRHFVKCSAKGELDSELLGICHSWRLELIEFAASGLF